jgi:hypothetical protein
MRSTGSRSIIIVLVAALFLCTSVPAYSQQKLVDPKAARDCGCTLRKWPLLSDFLSRAMPAIESLQPDTVLPHYADAGCGVGPRLPLQGLYGEVRYSHVASLDLFIDHDWHDFNLFVAPGGETHYLSSLANPRNNNRFLCYKQNDKSCPSVRGETLLEAEWDTRHYPERFWASAGDSVWMLGRYVWDCGHPNGYHTEIHPPKAIALTRLEPYVFPGDDSPSLTNKTYVYVNGKSGMKNYNFKTVEGVESVVFDGYKDAPVANQDYGFDLPLPAKPAGYSRPPVAKVIELPFGGPSPELTIDSAERLVHVKYPLKLADLSPERRFAAVIVAGWRAPVANLKFRKLTVHVEQISILKAHNVVSLSEWKLWLNINGQWMKIEGLPGSESPVPLKLDRLLNLGGLVGAALPSVKIDKYFQVIVPDTEGARLTIQISGWVNVYDALFGAREDVLNTGLSLPSGVPQIVTPLSTTEGQIGVFFKQFSRANGFGVGGHNRRQGDYTGELSSAFEEIDGTPKGGLLKGAEETQGDFAIAYTISETPGH